MASSILALLFLNQYHVVIMLFEIIVLMSIGVFDDSESFADVSAVFLLSMMIGYALYYTSYIQELRIREACRLLETTEDSSAEIARESGFNDIKFFYQTFKKTMGMTPAKYRKTHQDKDE